MQKCLALGLVFLFTLTACSRDKDERAQGYIEGKYTYVASPIGGRLDNLPVVRGMTINKGQLLYSLDKQPESDEYLAAKEILTQAYYHRDAAIANLNLAKLTYERNKTLVPKRAIQQSELDRATANYETSKADLAKSTAAIAELNADLEKTKWKLSQKEIQAPIAGLVFDTFYREGEYVDAGKPVVSLLGSRDIKAIFFIEEALLGGVRLNDKISVTCDGLKEKVEGRISYISPTAEYTPPVIYSTDTSPKLVFRIEAEFAENNAKKLHPGQPAMVSYIYHG